MSEPTSEQPKNFEEIVKSLERFNGAYLDAHDFCYTDGRQIGLFRFERSVVIAIYNPNNEPEMERSMIVLSNETLFGLTVFYDFMAEQEHADRFYQLLDPVSSKEYNEMREAVTESIAEMPSDTRDAAVYPRLKMALAVKAKAEQSSASPSENL